MGLIVLANPTPVLEEMVSVPAETRERQTYRRWPINGVGFVSESSTYSGGVDDAEYPGNDHGNPGYPDSIEASVAPNHYECVHCNSLDQMLFQIDMKFFD
jgi:hypothetical protein